MPRRRLGVVLLLPAPVAREVDALRRALGDPGLDRKPAHLTLAGPVNVREDRLDEAIALVRKAAAAVRPFALRLGPPTSFLPVNPVPYLRVGGDVDAVHRLKTAIAVEPLHRASEYEFVPHVTLSDECEPARIEAAVAALLDFVVDATVERVTVLEEGEDRVWRPIADAPLRGPAVIGRGGLELELTVTERLDPGAQTWKAEEWATYDAVAFGAEVREQRIAVTARRSGEVVGTALGWVASTQAHLGDLLVGATVRDEGIGAHLLAAFVSEAASRGATQVTLRTRAGGRAQAFYERHGFTADALLPGYDWGEDGIHLRRVLH